MSPGRRSLVEWALLAAALVAVSGMAAWQGWLWRADHLLYDAGLSLASRTASEDIVIVAIDEESLARIGRWPWRRAIHATLLQRLADAGAAAVGMDVILNETDADNPRSERVLAEAIRRNGRVVLPVVPHPVGPGMLSDGTPIPPFAQAAAALGHIEMQLDGDGIARGIHLFGGAEKLYPQLALAMLQVAAPAVAARYLPAGADANATEPAEPAEPAIAWRREGWLHPPFAGPPGTYRTLSYVDVLTGAIKPERLKDKLVLVGATASGLGDIYPTPMSRSGRPMAGVEIHATVLDALRSGSAIEWLSPEKVAAITMLVVLALMFGLLHLSPRDGLLLSAALGLGAIVGGIELLNWGQVWLPPSAILIGAALAYPLWSWRRLDSVRRFVDAELEQLRDSEPGTAAGVPIDAGIDPLESRIAIVRAAAERQRSIQKEREDTMRFVSHDIRSPLASILTLIEGAGNAADPRLRQVERYAQRALDLADDFFRLAMAETLDRRGFSAIDLSSLAQEAADEIWPLAESRRIIVLVKELGHRDAMVLGNRPLLLRAVLNLLGNAIKFSPPGTAVDIVLRDNGAWQEIVVIDRGRGIAEADLGKLFTRYGRIISDDQPNPPGSGLGLLIVKTIAERHGGGVTVASTPGAGSIFGIRLPHAAFGDD